MSSKELNREQRMLERSVLNRLESLPPDQQQKLLQAYGIQKSLLLRDPIHEDEAFLNYFRKRRDSAFQALFNYFRNPVRATLTLSKSSASLLQ